MSASFQFGFLELFVSLLFVIQRGRFHNSSAWVSADCSLPCFASLGCATASESQTRECALRLTLPVVAAQPRIVFALLVLACLIAFFVCVCFELRVHVVALRNTLFRIRPLLFVAFCVGMSHCLLCLCGLVLRLCL